MFGGSIEGWFYAQIIIGELVVVNGLLRGGWLCDFENLRLCLETARRDSQGDEKE